MRPSSACSVLALHQHNSICPPQQRLQAARDAVEREHGNPVTLLDGCNDLLRPINGRLLAMRLQSIWKSTTPTNSMTADAWLVETGRLLKHLPADIVVHAIDQAIRANVRGFTPTAGAILAVAEPLHAERVRIRDGLMIVAGRADMPTHPGQASSAPKQVCTPAEASAILAQYGIDTSSVAVRGPKVPTGNRAPGRVPTREDYLRMGIAPEALEAGSAEA